MKLYRFFALLTTFTLLVSALGVTPAGAVPKLSGMDVRQVKKGVSAAPHTGGFTRWKPGTGYTAETPNKGLDGKGPNKLRPYFNRSLSDGNSGPAGPAASSPKMLTDPKLKASFEGLNFFQQRWARGGNQWSVEPPDQGLCAGNGFVVESVNDVVNIYNSSGQSVLPANDVGGAVDLNSFYGYPAAIDRTNIV